MFRTKSIFTDRIKYFVKNNVLSIFLFQLNMSTLIIKKTLHVPSTRDIYFTLIIYYKENKMNKEPNKSSNLVPTCDRKLKYFH